MPIYEYECDKCHYIFEEIIFGSDSDIECPKCESKRTKKLMSASSALGLNKGSDPLGAMPSMSGSNCGSGGFS
jgi:putative FmdB family regulatory protein